MRIGENNQTTVRRTVKGQSTVHDSSHQSLVFSGVVTGTNEGGGVRGTDRDCRDFGVRV